MFMTFKENGENYDKKKIICVQYTGPEIFVLEELVSNLTLKINKGNGNFKNRWSLEECGDVM